MPSYLVESFLPRASSGDRRGRDGRARLAAEVLARSGTRVRFAGSIHVPEDELYLYAFDAPTAEIADLVVRNAGIEPLRVVEVSMSLTRRRSPIQTPRTAAEATNTACMPTGATHP